ncbi:MAG: Rrf2 family transcriptional regulator [Deltaproteobacteria bacterium]|nr:Rrf2 family transcriptional regulator [Deltaproteobacteria bacterium]
MKIPTMLRYGVRMVVTLAQKGEVMSTAGLAKEMGVSPLYLRQLAPVLERAGIIQSFRGARGGYILKARPGEITIFEIIRAFDEDFSLLDCVKSSDSCPRSPDCKTRYLWKDLSDVVKKTLQDMTLKQLMERKNKQNTGGNGWVEYII